MKILLVAVFMAATAGCASFDLPPPQRIAPSTGNPLADAFAGIKMLQDDYLVEYRRLSGDANFYNGVSITAAIATLGFAAFDAHQDNVLGAALVSGIADKTSGQLQPGTKAAVYYRAIKSLTCVDTNARQVLQNAQATGPAINIDDLINGAGLGQASYEQLGTALWELRSRAADIEIPSKDLVAAVGEATVAEAALSHGSDAAVNLQTTITDATALVAAVVEKQPIPSLTTLVTAITKIEYKKPESAPGTGSNSPAGQKLFSLDGMGSLLAFKASQDNDSKKIARAIMLVVRRVSATHPEIAEAASKRVTACAVAFGASDGKAASS